MGRCSRPPGCSSEAEAILAESGTQWWPADRADVEHNREIISSRLNEELFRSEYEIGQRMPLNQAFAYTLEAS